MKTPSKKFMKAAIKEAMKGSAGYCGGPFGACVVKNGKIIGLAHNEVLKTNDPVRHAEVVAISRASKKLKRYDLSECEIYATTEPCPMCFSAIHWARIERVVYGTSISDVKKLGFNELAIPAKKMKKTGASKLVIKGAFMKKECLKLLKFWDKLPCKTIY